MAILRIAPENITLLWPQLGPMVEGALRGIPTHDAEDVRCSLLSLQAHLFARMNGQVVESFIVTQFVAYPKGIWLHVWLTASLPDISFDVAQFFQAADRWREQNGCRGMQMTGARMGWIKTFIKACPRAQIEGVTIRIDPEY